MSWKNWPAWLKGGVITSLLGIILIIPTLVNMYTKNHFFTFAGSGFFWYISIPFFAIYFIIVLSSSFIFKPFCSSTPGWPINGLNCPNYITIIANILDAIFFILFFFAIGSLIGFIIQKIKSRKEKQNEPK